MPITTDKKVSFCYFKTPSTIKEIKEEIEGTNCSILAPGTYNKLDLGN